MRVPFLLFAAGLLSGCAAGTSVDTKSIPVQGDIRQGQVSVVHSHNTNAFGQDISSDMILVRPPQSPDWIVFQPVSGSSPGIVKYLGPAALEAGGEVGGAALLRPTE